MTSKKVSNLSLPLRACPDQFVQLKSQGDLRVLLGQLLELHAGRPLVPKQLKKRKNTIKSHKFGGLNNKAPGLEVT